MGKEEEEFHWIFGVVQGWFSAKLDGSKISDGSQLSAQCELRRSEEFKLQQSWAGTV
jgi:hypothetical protein